MRPQNTAKTAEAVRWRRIREALFGDPTPDRVEVAEAFGVSIWTINRYEANGPPLWYRLALEGLAARKRKGQPRG